MPTTLFKEVTYSLSKLVQDIEMGEIGLPDIQRPFVWKNNRVRDLFDSMFRGFPVGYLLFWANGGYDGQRTIGTDSKQKVPRLLIVDGQQRLTSLYAVLKGVSVVREDFRKERIRISFRPRDSSFEVANAATLKDHEYIHDISELWSTGVAHNRFIKDFLTRLRTSREVSDDEEDRLSDSIGRLFNLQDYPFTAMELSSSVDETQVSEIFVRINSKGKTLNQADFILTLMSVFWDEGRTEIEKFCRDSRVPSAGTASPYNPFIDPMIRRPCAPCDLVPAGIPGLVTINATPYEIEILGELPRVGNLEIDGYRLTKGNGEAHDLCYVDGRWECTCGDWIFRRSVMAEPHRADCKHIHAIRQLGLPEPRDSYTPDLDAEDVITLAEPEDEYVTGPADIFDDSDFLNITE
jgi:hypothetical protein